MKFRIRDLIIFIFLIYSCATVHSTTQTHIIENVPFYPQTSHQCGPASLAGVLNYWGIKVTPEEIAGEIYSNSARGTLNIDMVLYAQKKGLKAIQYEGTMEDLRKNIDSRRPIIVLVDYGFFSVQANHFMVVIGYNEDGVIVNSGKDKEKFISEKDFLKIWGKTKFWTLLIQPNE
jgi:predicted double-glycine peptidase